MTKPAPVLTSKSGKCRIVIGDVLDTLATHKGEKFKLVFADPPFNIGRKYRNWNDAQPLARYEHFLSEVIPRLHGLVAQDGALVINCWDNAASFIDTLCTKRLGLHRQNWIIWTYEFAVYQRNKFSNAKQHVLYYSREKLHTGRDLTDVQVKTKRAMLGDKRTQTKKHGIPGFREPLDVWQGDGFHRIHGKHPERWPLHDNQLPLRYVTRLVKGLTKPGDAVLDAFCGSGTFPLVCDVLGRSCVSHEITREYAKSAMKRVHNAEQRKLAFSSFA